MEEVILMDSILTSIKKLLGIDKDYTHFDTDIIIHINMAFSELLDLGVGPEEGYSIEDDSAVWTNFIEDGPLLSKVKDFVYLKVRLIFDPPASSAVMDSINRQLDKLEWKINVMVDPGKEENSK